MANYRTVRELKPYKGADITRLHTNGSFYYFAFMGDGPILWSNTLKELKEKVRKYDKAELCKVQIPRIQQLERG